MAELNLFKKYNVAGPRYTSYPTVPYWETNPTESQWIESIDRALSDAEKEGSGAAVYLHIPFCESLCTYCGCNTRITRNHAVAIPYIETLIQEVKNYKSRITRPIRLSELHLGGGTPTFLSPDELKKMLEGLLSQFDIHSEKEFSVEADPRVTTRAHLEALREFGFTRLSLGIQDFDVKVQKIVNRVQTVEQVAKVVEDARSLGYTSVNFDLIYGLPLQTLKSVEETLQAVRTIRPDRIAFYSYAHVPWIKPGMRKFTEKDLPDGEAKRALYELGRALFADVGYHEVGMDHFALESDSLWQSTLNGKLHRNFMGYISKKVTPLLGFGVSSIGDSWYSFAQNEKLLETYQNRVHAGEIPIHRGHLLNDEDLVIRRHVLNLMTQFETDWSKTENYTESLVGLEDRLQEFHVDDLIEFGHQKIKVKNQGRAFLRNICMAFDARLARKAPGTQLFSKTI